MITELEAIGTQKTVKSPVGLAQRTRSMLEYDVAAKAFLLSFAVVCLHEYDFKILEAGIAGRCC